MKKPEIIGESEQELVERFKQGDESAFMTLYERVRPQIYRYCLHIVKDPADAEDITQEVIMRAWQNIDKYRGEAQFQRWLLMIAKNVAINTLRRRRPLSSDLIVDELPDLPAEHAASPEMMFLHSEFVEKARQAIAELPDVYQTAMRLLVDGHTTAEIAEILNISQNAVGMRLFHARKILREKLRDFFEVQEEEQPETTKPKPTFTRIPNPYIAGNPVLPESGMFVGRQQIFRFVEENIVGLRQKVTVVLHGQRRMGKSSILRNLETYLSPDFIPVYVDMQRAAAVESTGGLLYNLAEPIYQELRHRRFKLPEPQIRDYSAEPFIVFSKFLDLAERKIKAPQKRFVLSLDEFEQIEAKIETGQVSPDFLGYLRNIMQHREGIVLIFAGTHTLEDMIRDYWSVFFGSTRSIKVSYLDELDARRLIRHPMEFFPLTYERGAVELIIGATHCQPYLVQLVCFELVNLKNQQKSNRASVRDVEVALERALRAGDYYFEGLWQLSEEDGQSLLCDLARTRKATIKELAGRLRTSVKNVQAVIERLNRLDILEGGAGGQVEEPVRFQVELLRRWAERHTPRSRSTVCKK